MMRCSPSTVLARAATLVLLLPAILLADDVREAVKKALPATVAVHWEAPDESGEATAIDAVTFAPDGGKILFAGGATRPPQPADSVAMMSGTVVAESGLIVAPYDPSREGKGEYAVTTNDGRRRTARVLVTDHRSGLLLLKIDAADLDRLEPFPEAVELGQLVATTFCTDEKQRQVSQGIVSAQDGSFDSIAIGGLIRTDAAVGKMSAGAPLVDATGRLLGIVIGREESDGSTAGSLAIPAGYVAELLEAKDGENAVVIYRGYLGVSLSDKEIDAGGSAVMISSVVEDSPAAQAGLTDGERILSIDGKGVQTASDVTREIGRRKAGQRVEVRVKRDLVERTVAVALGRPPRPELTLRSGSFRIRVLDEDRVYAVDPTTGEARELGFEYRRIPVARSAGEAIPGGEVARYPQVTEVPAVPSYGRLAPSVTLYPPLRVTDVPAVISVERSELQKELDGLRREVEVLSRQVQELAAELKARSGDAPERQ